MAVGTDAQGQSVVYVAKPNEEGAMIATAVPVTTGMETDFYLEISSDGLADGDQVLSDASTVIPGHARHAWRPAWAARLPRRRDGGLSMRDEKLA